MDDKKHPSQPQSGQATPASGSASQSPGTGEGSGNPAKTGPANTHAQASATPRTAAGSTSGGNGQKPANAQADAQKEPENPAYKSRRLFSKKWLYPSIYLGAAVLIIGLMYVRSQTGAAPATANGIETGANTGISTGTAPGQASLTWQSPYAMGTQAEVTMGFFPGKGTTAQQAQAMVFYDNAWYPHEGIDIKAGNGQSFTVTSAAPGTVSSVVDDPLMGKTVIVESADGYTEHYESLATIDVKEGDSLAAGQTIGTSGADQFEAKQGNHLYFAVYQNDQAIDPTSVLPRM